MPDTPIYRTTREITFPDAFRVHRGTLCTFLKREVNSLGLESVVVMFADGKPRPVAPEWVTVVDEERGEG